MPGDESPKGIGGLSIAVSLLLLSCGPAAAPTPQRMAREQKADCPSPNAGHTRDFVEGEILVRLAEPVHRAVADAPNDPLFKHQWVLRGVPPFGSSEVGIDAPDAWTLTLAT